MMPAIRVRHPEPLLPEESLPAGPLITVRAGEDLVVRVGAVDRQTGIAGIIARCRSCENHELASSGRWSGGGGPRGDNYYPVVIPIPRHSPTVVWELQEITLWDGEGNRRSYEAGRDFDPMLFRVLGRNGVDCTPPRLLGVSFGRA
jgi:hypothetical protein